MENISLYVDWEKGLDYNKVNLYKNKMWEESFGHNSTFYKYFINDKKVNKCTTILAYIGEQIAGVLIFPHLENMEGKVKTKEGYVSYYSIGEVQIYVKPEYRKMNIAKKMIQKLNKDLPSKYGKNKVLIVQAVQKAFPIVSKYMTNFLTFEVYEDDKECLEYELSNYLKNKEPEKKLSVVNNSFIFEI